MLGSVALWPWVPPQAARAQQGGGQLRTGLADPKRHFAHPKACGPPSTPSSGQGQRLPLPWSSLADPLAPLPQSIIPTGGREHVLCCCHPLPDGGIYSTASPSTPSWPRWDTAAQLNPTAAPRAPHAPAIRVLSLSHPECRAGQSRAAPQPRPHPAALCCWHCHSHPFPPHHGRGAPQPVLAGAHGEMPALLCSSALGSPVKH